MDKKAGKRTGMAALLAVAALCGCTDGTGDPISAGPNNLNAAGTGGSSGAGGGGGQAAASKQMDLLFVVDNSASMKDKQIQLANVAPELLTRLVNPRCVDGSGAKVAQPSTPQEPCPAGSAREFEPVADLHVGVISSSLGSHGGDYCVDVDREEPEQDARRNFTQNDRGRLLDRGLRKDEGEVAFPTEPTYNGLGFLVWDPAGAGSPPGEKEIAQVAQGVRNLVLGADQIGCGYEAPLEAWYRFLVDPEPPAVVKPSPQGIGGTAVVEGIDTTLLAQRAAFLRPDSRLLIVMLTDEDDCSIIDGTDPSNGNFPGNHLASQLRNNGAPFQLKSGTPACADDPYSPECKECYTGALGCVDLPTEEDGPNLRCWDQKRRFGVDMLYPIRRYVDGLTSKDILARSGKTVLNPLFAGGRSPESVIFAGMVGVPWQDIARSPSDPSSGTRPTTGPDALDWELILGDPFHPDKSKRHGAKDPLMNASDLPRQGTLIDGSTLSTGAWNPINGREWNTSRTDLQYSCIFRLGQPRDCADALSACDCVDPEILSGNPLCEETDPVSGVGLGVYSTVQRFAKAYPTPRILQLLKDIGPQAALGSLCAADGPPPESDAASYRPALQAILGAVASRWK